MDSLLNHPQISARCFFPLLGEIDDPFWVECGDARLACSYHQVDPQARTLIHFHGNGEIVDDWPQFAAQINRSGWNCLLAEYRGYGRSTGRAQMGRILADVVPIVESLNLPSQQLVFFGRSIGSLFAVEAAARFPHAAGLVLESAIADIRTTLLAAIRPQELGVDESEFARILDGSINQQRKLESFAGPLLVLHTENDGLIDVGHARKLYGWGQGPKQLEIFERGDHNTISSANGENYYRTIGKFLHSL